MLWHIVKRELFEQVNSPPFRTRDAAHRFF